MRVITDRRGAFCDFCGRRECDSMVLFASHLGGHDRRTAVDICDACVRSLWQELDHFIDGKPDPSHFHKVSERLFSVEGVDGSEAPKAEGA